MSGALAALDLRTAGAADIAALERLMVAAFDPRFGEAWTRSQCMGVLGMPGVWLTLAEIGSVSAGFALARTVADEAELLLLATHPAHRRRGVGGALLRSVMEACRARDLASLHLEVRAGNDADRLYRAAGFVAAGIRRGYYRGSSGQSFDARTFRCDLVG